MTSIPHEPSGTGVAPAGWSARLPVRELCVAISITVMWLAVLVDAIVGPNIVSVNGAQMTTVPSAVVVAFFAFLGSWVVARYGLGRRGGDA